jgi:outer membrane protein OmpA-like peptidoglycan-associated protein
MTKSGCLLTIFLTLILQQLNAQDNFNGMMSTYGDTAFDGWNGIMELQFTESDTSGKSLNGIMTTYEPQTPGLEGKENGLMDTYFNDPMADTMKKPVRILPVKNDLLPALSANFFFEINYFRLTKASRDTLMKFLPILQSSGIEKIHLHGYTDDSGPVSFNQRLSQQRAEVLKNWLISNGVNASLIEAKGMGPQECEGFNAAQWRKVELQIELK